MHKLSNTDASFFKLIHRVQESPLYDVSSSKKAPYGFYGERTIIGPETELLGGVYLGSQAHEAVVIDESYGALEDLFQKLVSHVDNISFTTTKQELRFVEYVFALAQETLPIDHEKFDAFYLNQKLDSDQKVSLDLIIQFGWGLERHQVLLASYLLQKSIRAGILAQGKIDLSWQCSSTSESVALRYTSKFGRAVKFNVDKQYKKITKVMPYLIMNKKR